MSGLLNLLLTLVIFGVLLGLINRFLPMPAFIKILLNIVVSAVLLVYVLQYFEIIFNVLPTIEIFHSPASPKS